ncbi:MAG TPA: N-acetylmuramoyl-L-alanine amidase [Syntrophomonas sp.]|nr:N-acetylmuramoyl-L-alanine amidase [Syntrophomonas sp.]
MITAVCLIVVGVATIMASMSVRPERPKQLEQPEQPVLSYALAGRVIAVDAGHGGIDPGASRYGYEEKDITLAISKKLVRYLEQAGAQVINLRTGDGDLCGSDFKGTIRERKRKDLALRVEKAKNAKADLYISIHTNADVSPRWSGAQTFYKAGQEESERTAVAIQDELIRVLGNNKREAKTGSYYILDKAPMPIVIVEVGFLSNPREAKLLVSNDYQDKVAYAIFSGIIKSYLPEEKNSSKLK